MCGYLLYPGMTNSKAGANAVVSVLLNQRGSGAPGIALALLMHFHDKICFLQIHFILFFVYYSTVYCIILKENEEQYSTVLTVLLGKLFNKSTRGTYGYCIVQHYDLKSRR